MKGILLLNGEPYTGKIEATDAFVVCCDGAYAWAKDKVRIDENVGDFDSLSYVPEPPPTEVYPAEKDFTDGEIAMRKLIACGADEVEIYGACGGREDHFLGNLHLLHYACGLGVRAKIITEKTVIIAASGKITLNDTFGRTFSVLPFGGDVHILYSKGFKYVYPEVLKYGTCRGVSNVGTAKVGELETGVGETVLIIINRGEV